MEVQLGKFNSLVISFITGVGAFFEVDDNKVFLPKEFLPKDSKPGDELEVFVYKDSEEKLIGTTKKPYAMVGEAAYMQVKEETSVGAFMDWGINKDLLVPFKEQKDKMREGHTYLVYVFIDHDSDRIVGTSKVNRFINNEIIEVTEGDEVELLIGESTDLGVKTVINNKHLGLLYHNEIFKRINKGDKVRGFIKKIREDGAIDVSLQEQGFDEALSASIQILKKLKQNDGFLPVTDKTEPEIIYDLFQMSKKTFKKAVGTLYKERKITIEPTGLRLV